MSVAFFAEIWGNSSGFGEIRMIRKGRDGRPEIRQSWHELNDTGLGLLAASETAGRHSAEHWDVYYGVVPRTGRGGTAAHCPGKVGVLWADVDAKNFSSKEEAFRVISGARVSPSVIVDSGNGYHLYWLLREEIESPTATMIMKGIAKAIGGDAVADIPRVLRVPGTSNWKRDPLPVRLLMLDSRARRSIDDFAPEIRAAEAAVRQPTRLYTGEPMPLEKLPGWLTEIIINPAPRGARSETAFKACLWLARYGWSDGQIEQLFLQYPTGVGEKYAERRDGSRWLATTLRAARSVR
jgi:hypothetical protein